MQEKKIPKKLPEKMVKLKEVIPLNESVETEPEKNKDMEQCIEAL